MATVIDGFTLLSEVQGRIANLQSHTTLLVTILSRGGNKRQLDWALNDARELSKALEALIEVVK